MSAAPSGSPAEDLAVLASKVGTASSTPLGSGAADMKNFAEALVVVTFADMANEAIDVKLQKVDSDGTSNPVDIVGRAITQLAASATANDNKVIKMGMKVEDLPTGARYFRALITTGNTTGGTVAVTIIGTHGRYGPVSAIENALVVQTVA